MANKLFIGSLDWATTEEELRGAFAKFGEITEVAIPRDQLGRSRGFGFVTFANEGDAKQAIGEMNEQQLGKRKIFVNEAKPREDRN